MWAIQMVSSEKQELRKINQIKDKKMKRKKEQNNNSNKNRCCSIFYVL